MRVVSILVFVVTVWAWHFINTRTRTAVSNHTITGLQALVVLTSTLEPPTYMSLETLSKVSASWSLPLSYTLEWVTSMLIIRDTRHVYCLTLVECGRNSTRLFDSYNIFKISYRNYSPTLLYLRYETRLLLKVLKFLISSHLVQSCALYYLKIYRFNCI